MTVFHRFTVLATALTLAACAGLPLSSPSATAPAAPPKKVRIGLALGGGAAKGFAHVGVIKVLEAHGLTPDFVAGTSAGAVVGSLYAAGFSGFQLQEMALTLDQSSITDWVLPNAGVLKGERLEGYINQQVGHRPIEKLTRPFAAVTADLATGQRVAFRRGNTGQAVRASAAVPGVFQPVKIGTRRFVDGGITSPVPVLAAREMGAEVVIAVDISTKLSGVAPDSTLSVLDQSLNIMGQKLSEAELARAEVVIRPNTQQLGSADFDQRHRAILEGEKATQAALPAIRRALAAAASRTGK